MATVQRTVYYYTYSPDALPTIADKIQVLHQLPVRERAYTHKGQQVLFTADETDGKISGFITLLRQNGMPAIGRRDTIEARELDLAEDEGLSEGSHFVISPTTGLIGFEYNHFGPRATLLFEAVDKLYEDIDDTAPPTDWAVLQGSQGFDAVQRARGIKALEIAVTRSAHQQLNVNNETLNQAFTAAASLGETSRVKIELKGDRRGPGILMSPARLAELFFSNRNQVVEAYDRFKAKIVSETGGIETIDLLNDRVRTIVIVESTGRGRTIPRETLLRQMRSDIDVVSREHLA